MNRDWRDFKSLYGNIEGARSAFEKACEALYRTVFAKENVQQVEVSVGDGGIDIFVGNIGVSPITVIQCKFFLEEFGETQYSQIRNSFKKASTSDEFGLKEWILCIPIVLNLEQNKWWSTWKKKQEEALGLKEDFIQLKNGNELIDLLKEHNVYNQVFQIGEALAIERIDNNISKLCSLLLPVKVDTPTNNDAGLILFNNYTSVAEPFYICRHVDSELINQLKYANVWVHGMSGAGKTALILRTVISNQLDYLYCDYSPVDIGSANDVLDELKYIIMEKYHLTEAAVSNNKIKDVCSLLNEHKTPNKLIIIIDELSFPTKEIEGEFAKMLIQFATYHNKQPDSSLLRFVVSTIPEPLNIIKNKAKASEHFSYISVNDWEGSLGELLDLLVAALDLKISRISRKIILDKTNGSPRLLKNILRKIVTKNNGSITDDQIAGCAAEAQAEYF